MAENKIEKPLEEFQCFEDVTSKIFQVPIDEVRALEKLEKAKKDKTQASEG